MARAHTKAQGKYMTFVKRENCTGVKCFKPNMSSVDQCTGYCFASYKVVTDDYVGSPYGCAKFGANLSMDKRVKYNDIFYLYLFS